MRAGCSNCKVKGVLLALTLNGLSLKRVKTAPEKVAKN